MRALRTVLAVALLLAAPAVAARQSPDIEARVRAELAAARALSPALLKAVQPVIDQTWAGFSEAEAMRTVELASGYWRLSGNEGYNVTLDRVHARLTSSAATWVETADGPSPGWDHTVGTLSLLRDGQQPLTVLSKERERLALAINSYSTSGPVEAPLVDVGRGQPADFEGKDVKGAVVIGDADLGSLFRQAVVQRGAIGVISTSIARYIADDPDILQWGSIPRDAERKAFGFKASRRANETLRAALKSGPQRVRVEVVSTFAEKPERTLVHEIKGRALPNERIVIAAHLQEPGANDNASGVATLQEMAVALTRAIESGAVARPARTITFLWLNEISGSRSWLQRHADQVPGVKYMFSMDMTGQDLTKTGGSFLVERWPDPGAIWARPWDPNSEWGRGNVRKESLKGDLLNDLHLAVCERVAQKTGWVVKTNPYEGGSDHTVFGTAGIPSLLNWHFTDRYYHTNMDTPDKTSAAEMRNVGVAVATSAWLLASADETLSLEVAELVARAGRVRIAVEQREGALMADHAEALAAWRTWSAEAVRSVSRLVTGPVAPSLNERLEEVVTLPAQTQACSDLTREGIILAADRRITGPCAAQDLALLTQAAASADIEFRRLAVQAFGRTGAASMAPRVFPLLDDPSSVVRAEAANAIGQALSGTRSDLRDDGPPTPAEVTAGRVRLDARLEKETDDKVSGVILATIGRMRHDTTELAAIEELLVAGSTGSPDRLVGAVKGFESFTRRNPRRPLTEPARARLRELAGLGRTATGATAETLTRLRRLVMTTLQVARDTDTVTMLEAAEDPDWQVRRIAAQMMNPAIDRLHPSVIALLKDPSLHVRIDAVRTFARGLQTIPDCTPLVAAMNDTATIVSLQAMDSVTTGCANLSAVVAALTPLADQLADSARASTWHRPARALTALARVAPDEARKRIAAAKTHSVWQVRATAATAAGVLNDAAVALELSKDAAPNVRTAAIDALVRLKSADVSTAAIAALASDDHQLVRSAARALQASTHADVVPSLFTALRRLTTKGADTSRDPRVAIVDRLAELLGPARAGELSEWALDWDGAVSAAAARALTAAKVAVPAGPRQYRALVQPTPAELRELLTASEADIVMADGGTITLRLIASDAPMAVARFVTRARSGAYNGLTFHRVVANFVVQGLSPGANEYVGDDRFMRDDVSLQSHTRGAVGISTRGYDTGDAQIFFDLIDVPRLDHDYTVFARVTAGIEHVDAILEGAVVTRVVVR